MPKSIPFIAERGKRKFVLAVLIAGALALAAITACGSDPLPEPTPATVDLPSPAPAGAVTGSPTPSEEGPDDSAMTPTATAVPRATAAATITPPGKRATTGDVDEKLPASEFPVPPDMDYYRLAKRLIPGTKDVDRVVKRHAGTLKAGHRATFKLVDLDSGRLYESEFELRLVTPHAYWFVEDGVRADQKDIEWSAKEFEDRIYPTVTGVFGNEWRPGVDGDPHLYVINAHLRGVGGYFSTADEYPREIRPVSNEIEAIYINARYLPIGTDVFSYVIAHELQHAIHWNADPTEETWVNEGLSELAMSIVGYPDSSVQEFRRAGPTSLTQWPANHVGGAENYGAASLFMHYLTEQYGGQEDLRPLLEEASDGIRGVDAFLEEGGHGVTFTDVFRDWAVANLLDEDIGRFGYSELDFQVPVYGYLKGEGELSVATPQYANQYVRLEALPTAARLTFHGDETVALLPVDTGDGCWWSNNGDVIDSTLTAHLDLRRVEHPVLDFQVWFAIEEDWDFAYLEVSRDDGQTWAILETPLTSSDDLLEVSFGPGYTGASDGWQDESIPLDRWSGQQVLVRFQYITDAAVHDHGLCLRNIRGAGDDADSELEAEWVPDGFVWTNNLARQSFMVQVVYEGDAQADNRALHMELDEANKGNIILESGPGIKRIVAVIQPMAPATRIPSSYTLRLETIE